MPTTISNKETRALANLTPSYYNISDEVMSILESTARIDMTVSELVGRVRLPVFKLMGLTAYGTHLAYWVEKAILTLIVKTLSNTPSISIVMNSVPTWIGDEIHIIKSHRVTECPSNLKLSRSEKSLPTESKHSLVFRGHSIPTVNQTVDVAMLNCSETLVSIKPLNTKLLHLYAHLKLMKIGNQKSKETFRSKSKRVDSDLQKTLNIIGDALYMYNKVDSRGRKYPLIDYGFINPYGDHFQSRLFEMDKPYITTQLDIDYAKYLLYTTLNGRTTFKQALESYHQGTVNFKIAKLIKSLKNAYREMLVYKANRKGYGNVVSTSISPNDLGDTLYILELNKLIINGIGKESCLMVEVDMTNSGLIHLANVTRNPKLMASANLSNNDKVYDSHTDLLVSLKRATNVSLSKQSGKDDSKLRAVETRLNNMTRNDMKNVGVVLYHGGSLSTMAKALDIPDLDFMANVLTEAYDDTWKIPNRVVQLNRKLLAKGITTPQWTLPDGFVATGVSYTTNTRITVDGMNIYCDMPSLPNIQHGGNTKSKISHLYAKLA